MHITWAALERLRRSPAHNVVFVLAIGAALILGSYGEGHPTSPADKIQFGTHPIPHSSGALLLVAVACLALAWRRRWPLAVLAVSTGAVVIYTLLGYVNGAALLAPTIALYSVATQVTVRRAVAAAAATLVLLMTATGVANPFGRVTGGGFYLIPALVAAACFGGIAVTNRRAYVSSIQAQAEQDARRRIDEERLRIARELHDVVAHTMATINVQAGAAAHVAAERPDAAAEALQAIKAASRQGLRELRAILNVLRQADEADPTQPAPGIAQVGVLVTGARQAGLRTELTVSGEPHPLPAAVDLAAYRIVQESLTNAIRHAGPATATVSLIYGDSELRIEVADTGGQQASTPNDGAGHGLAGMRERAASVGGAVETGPRPSGGYRVMARLPTGGPPPAQAEQPGNAGQAEQAGPAGPAGPVGPAAKAAHTATGEGVRS